MVVIKWRGLHSSGICLHTTGWLVPHVSRQHCSLIFRGQIVKNGHLTQTRPACCLEMWHHIPNDMAPYPTWREASAVLLHMTEKSHIHGCIITRGGRPVTMYIKVVLHYLSITWIKWKCQIFIWIYVMPNFPYRCFCITVSLKTWNKSDSDQYNSFSERLHIKYTWMLFPIYQHMTYLWVFPSAVVQECVDQLGFGFGKKFTSQTPLSLSVSCKLSFPIPSVCNHT